MAKFIERFEERVREGEWSLDFNWIPARVYKSHICAWCLVYAKGYLVRLRLSTAPGEELVYCIVCDKCYDEFRDIRNRR